MFLWYQLLVSFIHLYMYLLPLLVEWIPPFTLTFSIYLFVSSFSRVNTTLSTESSWPWNVHTVTWWWSMLFRWWPVTWCSPGSDLGSSFSVRFPKWHTICCPWRLRGWRSGGGVWVGGPCVEQETGCGRNDETEHSGAGYSFEWQGE